MTNKSPRASLRGAINANCKDCIYDTASDGSWRKQVENCTVMACSLYLVRPTSIKGGKV